jgi:hypothetical protein
MTRRGTKRSQNRCLRCGNTWYPRGKNVSSKCPNCGSTNIQSLGFDITPQGCITAVALVIGGLAALMIGTKSPGLFFVLLILGTVGYIAYKYHQRQKGKKEAVELAEQARAMLQQRQQYLLAKFGNDQNLVQRVLEHNIQLGDSKEFVLETFGQPVSTDSEILKTKTKEVWKYRKGNETRQDQCNFQVKFENDIVVGWDDKN